MIIQQLSVFIENKQGRLMAAADVLAKSGVNISALSLADTSDFGILRLIVDDPEKSRQALVASGVTVRVTDVIAVAMDDTPGGMLGALSLFADAGISVEYMYACVAHVTGKALMILRVDKTDAAEKLLNDRGLNTVSPSDIYRI